MSARLKYSMDFQRIATIKTLKGDVKVGDIIEYNQNPDGTLDVVLEFDPLLPHKIREEIERNPACLGIQSKVKSATKSIILT